MNFLAELFLNSTATVGLLGLIWFVFRVSLTSIFTSAIEHRYDKKLEAAKADIRVNEAELKIISDLLATKAKERDTLLLAKRTEAAEVALETLKAYAKLAMLVEMLKHFDMDVLNQRSDEKAIQEVFQLLLKSLNVDGLLKEAGKISQVLPSLYLDERSLALLQAYISIVGNALAYAKLISQGLGAKGLIKNDVLKNELVPLFPNTADSFDEYGDRYGYHWLQYTYDQLIWSLRKDVSNNQSDTEAAMNLVITSHTAQGSARIEIESLGLPKDVILEEDAIPKLPEVER